MSDKKPDRNIIVIPLIPLLYSLYENIDNNNRFIFYNWVYSLITLSSSGVFNPELKQEVYKSKQNEVIKSGYNLFNTIPGAVYANMVIDLIKEYEVILLTQNLPITTNSDIISIDGLNIKILVGKDIEW